MGKHRWKSRKWHSLNQMKSKEDNLCDCGVERVRKENVQKWAGNVKSKGE